MNRKDYPLWLKIALRCPLRWKHWLRTALLRAESWSTQLVAEDAGWCELIENTENPDFYAFARKLEEAKKAWGKDDPYLNRYALLYRVVQFKHTHKLTKET
jgi:hypothetical protein